MSGICGIVSKRQCMPKLFYCTDYHSHLGTEFAGLAVQSHEIQRKIHDISQGQFKSKFADDYNQLQGPSGIGVISSKDEQPIYINSKFGPFAICTNGFIENAHQLAKELLDKGISFSEITDGNINETELVAKLITQGKDLIDGIEKAYDKIHGSCSLLVLNEDGVYASRDRNGYFPLVIGQGEDNDWAITTETTAFPNLGFKIKKFLSPGEIVLLNKTGVVPKRGGGLNNQICAFLWIYTGFPASSYEGINVEQVREKCGQFLAKRDTDIKVDLVSGVPDSGTTHAIGYAMEAKVPFRRPLVKYNPGYGRSYLPPSQEIRDLIAKMKLIPIREIIEGKRLILCEDSIVRGTQLKNFTIKKLWENGAKEVHIRPACPPLMFPCRYNYSTRTITELAARKAIHALEGKDIEDVSKYTDAGTQEYKDMVEQIRKTLDATTLRYQTMGDMVKAIGLPKEKLCLYCWNGKCPEDSKCKNSLERQGASI